MVGIGEASYSTIAPTIISDLFVKDLRSKMLALFYFAIPVGSGLGYITGSMMKEAVGTWQWGLRVTPGMGILAIIFIVFFMEDPPRGESEGAHLEATSWAADIKDLSRK
jgi:MFS family permease